MNRLCHFRALFGKCSNRDIVQPVGLSVVGYNVPYGIHGWGEALAFVIYQTEGAFQLISGGNEDADLPTPDIAFQKPHGDNGQALVVQDCIAEGVRTGCFPGGADVQAVTFDKLIEQRPCAASWFPNDELLIFQLRYMDRFPVCKRVGIGTTKYEKVPDTRDHNQIRVVDFPFHNTDIQFRSQNLFFYHMCVSNKSIGLGVREFLGKIIQYVGDQAGADGNSGTDADNIFFATFLHCPFHLIELSDNLIGAVQKLLSGRRNVKSAGQTIEETGLIVFFQFRAGRDTAFWQLCSWSRILRR